LREARKLLKVPAVALEREWLQSPYDPQVIQIGVQLWVNTAGTGVVPRLGSWGAHHASIAAPTGNLERHPCVSRHRIRGIDFEVRMPPRTDALQGTLTLLILKTLDAGPRHGYAIAQHIQQTSNALLRVEEGSLYPALRRLEQEGWVKSTWSVTESQRKARVYSLTAEGQKQLDEEEAKWQRLLQGVRHVLRFAE